MPTQITLFYFLKKWWGQMRSRLVKCLGSYAVGIKVAQVKEILFSSNDLKLAGPQIIKRSLDRGTLLVGNWHFFIWQSWEWMLQYSKCYHPHPATNWSLSCDWLVPVSSGKCKIYRIFLATVVYFDQQKRTICTLRHLHFMMFGLCFCFVREILRGRVMIYEWWSMLPAMFFFKSLCSFSKIDGIRGFCMSLKLITYSLHLRGNKKHLISLLSSLRHVCSTCWLRYMRKYRFSS